MRTALLVIVSFVLCGPALAAGGKCSPAAPGEFEVQVKAKLEDDTALRERLLAMRPRVAKEAGGEGKVAKIDARVAALDSRREELRSKLRTLSRQRSCAGIEDAAVTDYRGTVEAWREGSWTTLSDKLPLKPGDKVRTRTDSSVRLALPDGSELHLGGNTTYEYSDHRSGRLFVGRFLMVTVPGAVRAGAKELTQPSHFRLTTQNMTAAVRGTEFEVEAVEEASTVALFSGAIDLEATKRTRPGPQWPALLADRSLRRAARPGEALEDGSWTESGGYAVAVAKGSTARVFSDRVELRAGSLYLEPRAPAGRIRVAAGGLEVGLEGAALFALDGGRAAVTVFEGKASLESAGEAGR